MKPTFLIYFLVVSTLVQAQDTNTKNIFIITTDGLRWQEVFEGADAAIITNNSFVKDTATTKGLYWDEEVTIRRQKLMPFFWNIIASKGQLYGNRKYNNKVAVKNIYKISYPGYNELLTGFADPKPILNYPIYNANISILEYLHNLPAYQNKVIAFSSWSLFPYILNSKRNNLPLNSGYQSEGEEETLNEVQKNVVEKKHTRYDLLTFLNAKQYVEQHHPRVVFLSLGETDEYAHKGRYDLYLQAINNIDRMIGELWYLVQTDSFYKNNTTFMITTDHGRGKKPGTWYTHNLFTKGSGETWLALLGSTINPAGEMTTQQTIYENQLAQTVAHLLGEYFNNKSTGNAIVLPKPTNNTWASSNKDSTPPDASN